jgi:hypothetical protein
MRRSPETDGIHVKGVDRQIRPRIFDVPKEVPKLGWGTGPEHHPRLYGRDTANRPSRGLSAAKSASFITR